MKSSIIQAFKNLLSKPITIDYPASPIIKPFGYRGLIKYEETECIYCLKCEKACPPEAILFVKTDNPSSNEKNKKGLEYLYNPYLCIYCQECVRACPKPSLALWQSEEKPLSGIMEDKVNEKWFEIENLKRGGKI